MITSRFIGKKVRVDTHSLEEGSVYRIQVLNNGSWEVVGEYDETTDYLAHDEAEKFAKRMAKQLEKLR